MEQKQVSKIVSNKGKNNGSGKYLKGRCSIHNHSFDGGVFIAYFYEEGDIYVETFIIILGKL